VLGVWWQWYWGSTRFLVTFLVVSKKIENSGRTYTRPRSVVHSLVPVVRTNKLRFAKREREGGGDEAVLCFV